MNQHIEHQYWQAAVFPRHTGLSGRGQKKRLYTGIFETRESAEEAGYKLCKEVKGVGFVCLQVKG